MAGIALKSCKFSVKLDNGTTATGRSSTKTYNFKGAYRDASADDIVGGLSSLMALESRDVLSYGQTDENLVYEE